MKKVLFLILLGSGCFIQTTFAQTAPVTPLDYEIQRAQETFNAKRYNTAAMLYKKLFEKIKDPEKQNDMAYMAGLSYIKSNNLKQAIKWFEQLVNTQYPNPDILYLYGECLKYFEQYDDAARRFYDYTFEKPKDPKGKLAQQSCAEAKKWKASPTRYAVTNVASVNSTNSDYSPYVSGTKIYFSSSRPEATGNQIFEWTGQKCSDLFEATMANAGFQKPVILKGTVNTPENEGTIWVDSTGTQMLYTQCNGVSGKEVTCKIYSSSLVNGNWSNPQPLPFCSDSFSCGHPAFSSDGKTLYFSSDMKGGFGEKDIYSVSYNKSTDQWGKPQNLGPNINTFDDDMFPAIGADGVLYFSSKGHLGMGGLDIFTSVETNGKWSKAENMKSPVNSGGDDFGITFIPQYKNITPGGVIAYFCSNRQNGMGDDDIYSISIKPYIFMVKGKVIDKEMKTPLPMAKVAITSGNNKPLATLKTDDKGEFIQELPYNNLFSLVSSFENYFSSAEYRINTSNMKNDSTLELNILLEPLPAPEQEITLKGIYYDVDKYDLRPESKTVLDSLVKIMQLNPAITIEIASHTDSRADAKYNLSLSQKRAQACVDYLVQKGIDKKRMTAVGYGETRLVNDCVDGVDCTEEQHQQNRRTTFRVLTTDFNK